ncbi:hypothetical protein ACLOJK_005252 [Asimina triloba]
MAREWSNVTMAELESLRRKYHIPVEFELIATDTHNNPEDPMSGSICANEPMLKVRVGLPFELDIIKALTVFNVASIQLVIREYQSLVGYENVKLVEK